MGMDSEGGIGYGVIVYYDSDDAVPETLDIILENEPIGCPIELHSQGSLHCEDVSYALVVAGTAQVAMDGAPKEVELRPIDRATEALAKEVCESIGVEWKPKWLLWSSWG